MKRILQSLALLLVGPLFATAAHAADDTHVHALLIMASDAKKPADPKLAPYEAELQRNLPESSFRLVSEGTGTAPARISLGQGDTLELIVEKRDSEGLHFKARWMKGDNLFFGGGFVMSPGTPLVLGRRPAGDGDVPIMLVIVK
jgi:hypothetical protein